MKKKYIIGIIILSIPFALLLPTYIPFPKSRLEPTPAISLQILDRNGKLLREVLSDEEGRCRWVNLHQVSPYVVKATIAGEDKNFFSHPGIDLLAVLRAIYQNIKAGKIVSGGSTITQQVVRNIYHFPRNWFWKIVEMWYALRLENSISKEEILVQYLNRIFYGNQVFGIESASLLYFDKPASHLSLAESAFLAGLPRSPSTLDPYRHFKLAKKRQVEILRRMLKNKMIDSTEYKRALHQPLNLVPKRTRFRAPHFCNYIFSLVPPKQRRKLSMIQTTLDYNLQREIELLLKNHIKTLEKHGVSNGAVIVLDNQNAEILAYAGSVDFFDSQHNGQINGILSLRQPGSTLKPFTYGLALEQGMTPANILPDIETHIYTRGGDFYPRNYDGKFHGPVRLRTALACSYNVPAVRVLEKLGTDLLLTKLHQLGFQSLSKKSDYYGVGLTLGNGEVTLLELSRAYSALAREGIFKKERVFLKILDNHGKEIIAQNPPRPITVFSSKITYILTNILADKNARAPAFGYNCPLNLPFPCAGKTGTSKDFRDNWTIGFTPKYTVGVWVGNFDGKPMHNVSGITGCGPLFHDIMLLLEKRGTGGDFKEPSGLVKAYICPLSGKIPNSYCPGKIKEIFIKGTEPGETCSFHQLVRIDKKTGFLAKDNIPEDQVIEQVMEIYPSLYHSWAIEEGKMQPYLQNLKISNSKLQISKDRICEDFKFKEQNSKIIITFPDNGDIFKIDPILRKEYQTIPLEIVVPNNVKKLDWYIDNRRYARVTYPFTIRWHLQPGEHTFKAIALIGNKKVKSNTIKIFVSS